MADAKQKRNEQLKRWLGSETDLEPPELKKKKTKVKFDDGAVFLAACSSGDTEEVLRMLDRGADINYANVDGLTALHQVRVRPLVRCSPAATLTSCPARSLAPGTPVKWKPFSSPLFTLPSSAVPPARRGAGMKAPAPACGTLGGNSAKVCMPLPGCYSPASSKVKATFRTPPATVYPPGPRVQSNCCTFQLVALNNTGAARSSVFIMVLRCCGFQVTSRAVIESLREFNVRVVIDWNPLSRLQEPPHNNG